MQGGGGGREESLSAGKKNQLFSPSLSLSQLTLSLPLSLFLPTPLNSTPPHSQLQPRRDRRHRKRRLRPGRGQQDPRGGRQRHLPRRFLQGLLCCGGKGRQERRRPSENLLRLVLHGQPRVGDGLQGAVRDHVRRLQVQGPDAHPQGLVQVDLEAVRERRLRKKRVFCFVFSFLLLLVFFSSNFFL